MKTASCFLLSLLWAFPLFAKDGALTQFATIDSLLSGVYDGHYDCGEVAKAGTLGLGTFEAIDGEMIVVDGIIYRVSADGSVAEVPSNERTPFAAVIPFHAEGGVVLKGIGGMSDLEAALTAELESLNFPVALRLEGHFEAVKARSPRRQEKPYPELAVVVKTQSVFEFEKTAGVMVGFYFPKYFEGINVPGLHLHFLTADRSAGGHVLGFLLEKGELAYDVAEEFRLELPTESDAFHEAALGKDRSEELKAVEVGPDAQ